MKEIRCKFCDRFLLEVDFEGKAIIPCRRCKSRNVVQSLAGSYLVTVTIDRRADTRKDKLPIPTRAVIE